jgi:hypothetical protein
MGTIDNGRAGLWAACRARLREDPYADLPEMTTLLSPDATMSDAGPAFRAEHSHRPDDADLNMNDGETEPETFEDVDCEERRC